MTAEAPSVPAVSTPRGRVETWVDDLVMMAAGLLGAGALVYYAWNWGVVAAFTFLKPLGGFWMGPMLVAGVYFVVVVAKMVLSDQLAISLNNLDALVEKVAPLASLLLLFYLVHHYLA